MFSKICLFFDHMFFLNILMAQNHDQLFMKSENVVQRIWKFYLSGFRDLSNWGKQVWIIILVKLFIMFVILRIFFFPDFLKSNFDNDQDRSEHVMEILTKSK